LASLTPGGICPNAFDNSFAWFSPICNFASIGLPGFAAVAGCARAGACAVRGFDFTLARFAALVDAPARRTLSFAPDFAFADRAALLLAAGRDGRETADAATALRLRGAAGPEDALVFFETVLDDFLLAFFRAAMVQTLQTRGNVPRRKSVTRVPIAQLLTLSALELSASRNKIVARGAQTPH
jgi:hypothetical protein